MKARDWLQDELEHRVAVMADTGDIPEPERLRTALQDIVGMDAEEHVAYATEQGPGFARIWTAIQKLAKAQLDALAPTAFDFHITYHGSLYLVEPLTDAAKAWLDENLTGETSWMGNSLAVEARYLDNLVEGILGDGLTTDG